MRTGDLRFVRPGLSRSYSFTKLKIRCFRRLVYFFIKGRGKYKLRRESMFDFCQVFPVLRRPTFELVRIEFRSMIEHDHFI